MKSTLTLTGATIAVAVLFTLLSEEGSTGLALAECAKNQKPAIASAKNQNCRSVTRSPTRLALSRKPHAGALGADRPGLTAFDAFITTLNGLTTSQSRLLNTINRLQDRIARLEKTLSSPSPSQTRALNDGRAGTGSGAAGATDPVRVAGAVGSSGGAVDIGPGGSTGGAGTTGSAGGTGATGGTGPTASADDRANALQQRNDALAFSNVQLQQTARSQTTTARACKYRGNILTMFTGLASFVRAPKIKDNTMLAGLIAPVAFSECEKTPQNDATVFLVRPINMDQHVVGDPSAPLYVIGAENTPVRVTTSAAKVCAVSQKDTNSNEFQVTFGDEGTATLTVSTGDPSALKTVPCKVRPKPPSTSPPTATQTLTSASMR